MRKKLSVGAVFAALIALAAVVAPAAMSGGGDGDHRGFKVIKLTSTVAQEGDIDVAPSSSSTSATASPSAMTCGSAARRSATTADSAPSCGSTGRWPS